MAELDEEIRQQEQLLQGAQAQLQEASNSAEAVGADVASCKARLQVSSCMMML